MRSDLLHLLAILLLTATTASAATPLDITLLEDDFTSYAAGLFFSELGAHGEYHYLPEAAPRGPWSVATFRSDGSSQRAWKVLRHEGQRVCRFPT